VVECCDGFTVVTLQCEADALERPELEFGGIPTQLILQGLQSLIVLLRSNQRLNGSDWDLTALSLSRQRQDNGKSRKQNGSKHLK
jgi:hypothetical protein